jgi:hypothetical protein
MRLCPSIRPAPKLVAVVVAVCLVVLAGRLASAATAGAVADAAAGALAAVADEALAAAERVRGVRLRAEVTRRVSQPADIRAYLVQRVRSEYPPEVLAAEEARYRRMGLLPPDAGLEETLIAALAANIAGFYGPETRTLHLAAGTTGALLRPVLVHEWTHALQHERLPLERVTRRVQGNGDYGAALLALLEGEAMAVSLAAELPEPLRSLPLADALGPAAAALDGAAFDAAAPDMPAVFLEELRFAYVDGLAAVLAAARRGGWAAVERWQRDEPPLSSEHVLHPERAHGAGRDCPQKLRLPSLDGILPEGARLSPPETLGEAGWRAFLRVHSGRALADAAAAGWDGDVYAVVQPTGDAGAALPALIVVSEWDSAADAAELARAARALGDRVPPLRTARWEQAGTRVAAWLGDGAPPPALLSTLLAQTQAQEVCDAAVFEADRRAPRAGEAATQPAAPR